MASHFGSWDDSGSSEDPTSIVRVLKDFESSRRKTSAAALKRKSSSPASTAAISTMGPKPKQLHFDASLLTLSPCTSTRKLPAGMRFKDPLIGIGDVGGNLTNTKKVLSDAEREAMRLKNELLQKESELVNARAANTRWEAQFERAQMVAKKERLERESETKKAVTDAARAKEEAEQLRRQLDMNKKRELAKAEAELESSTARRERAEDADGEIADLVEKNESLQRKVLKLRTKLEATQNEAREEVEEFMRQAEEARNQLEEARALASMRGEEGERAAQLKGRLEAAELRAKTAEMEAERAQSELRSNKEAVVERNAMKDRLNRYPTIVRENEALQKENKLLRDTADNVELLKEQNEHLVGKLERSEAAASEGLRLKHELAQAQKQLRKWETICLRVLTDEERGVLLESRPSADLMSQKIGQMQRVELEMREQNEANKSNVAAAERKIKHLEEKKTGDHEVVGAMRKDIDEQGKLIKRLQRKLLLVSKERDSYKGILESYEHEITFSGGQFEKDHTASLEKVIKDHREMIDRLERQLADKATTSGGTAGFTVGGSAELQRVEKALGKAEEERDALRHELNIRMTRGEIKPADTKILHLRNNPRVQAMESRQQEVKRLSDENQALKTRVKLLEEGQSKDLTILVGQKVEEGASSEEVKELQEQLRSAEVKKCRIIEAFKKTSHDFREVCCQLTGFRVDGLSNNQYRLTSIYAESPETEQLLFQRDPTNSACMLLETSYSNQLDELIDLHLKTQNSIPMFLAALNMDLFSKATFEQTASMSIEVTAAAPAAMGGDDEDPICLD